MNYLANQIEIDEILASDEDAEQNYLVLCSRTAFAVVQAAAIIIKNDIGSSAAELLIKAFNSQNYSH